MSPTGQVDPSAGATPVGCWTRRSAEDNDAAGSLHAGRVALAEQNRVAGSFRAGCVALAEQNVHPRWLTAGRVAVAEHFAGLAAASARDDGLGEQNRCRLPPECRDVRSCRRGERRRTGRPRDVRPRRRARRSSGPKPRDVRLRRRGERRRTGRPRDVRPGDTAPTSAAPTPAAPPGGSRPSAPIPLAILRASSTTAAEPRRGSRRKRCPRKARRSPRETDEHLRRPKPADGPTKGVV